MTVVPGRMLASLTVAGRVAALIGAGGAVAATTAMFQHLNSATVLSALPSTAQSSWPGVEVSPAACATPCGTPKVSLAHAPRSPASTSTAR